ncbi:MAG: hypothetical protein P4L98_16715 [Ancalomicrobiaceae bacterium]|nr:hypothetical protein [Ancalomicrobiaceae bacterium]
MNVTGMYGYQSSLVTALSSQRDQLNDLEQQLATGLKSQTFGGVGPGRSQALSFQTQLDQAGGYQDSINLASTRISLLNTSVQRIVDIGSQMQQTFNTQSYNLESTGLTDQQQSASNGLQEILSIFGSNAGGPYIFGGKSTNASPVADMDSIINGVGSQAGLKQVMSERLQADQGTNNMCRLVAAASPPSPATSTGVSLAEDSATSPFGMKLSGITSALTGATVTQPTGSPKSESVDFSTGLPKSGDTVSFAFAMPDGTSNTIKLTAGTANDATKGTFAIGADATTTAANLQSVLTGSIQTVSTTDLRAASAVQSGADFFNTFQGAAPQRVAPDMSSGTASFATATSLTGGTAADTVMWYTGDQTNTNPRKDATAVVDSSLQVNYGARANEPAFAWQVQQLAVATAFDASNGTATTKAAYTDLTNRIQVNLDSPPTSKKITTIQSDFASSYATATSAKTRHTTEISTYQTMVDSFEQTDQTTVITQLANLQTQMQASYQASSILLKLSLASYL